MVSDSLETLDHFEDIVTTDQNRAKRFCTIDLEIRLTLFEA